MRGITARLAREGAALPWTLPDNETILTTGVATVGKSNGSEKRQRTVLVGVRLMPAEKDELDVEAERAGMTTGCFIRHQVFGQSGPRARRRPTITAEGVSRLLGELGRVGSNINQMARVANSEGRLPTEDRLAVITAEVMDMRDALLEALGRQP